MRTLLPLVALVAASGCARLTDPRCSARGSDAEWRRVKASYPSERELERGMSSRMIPVAGAETAEDLGRAWTMLGDAGIANHLFGSKGWYIVVGTTDVERARAIISGDAKSRRYLMTEEEIQRYLRGASR